MRTDRITLSIRLASLLAAMFISFTVQRDLALAHGVPASVAWAVPLGIDLGMIWAVRVSRDVPLAVGVSVLANVAGTLERESLASVSPWISAALHAVFPLIVWRMERSVSHRETAPDQDDSPVSQGETAPVTHETKHETAPVMHETEAPSHEAPAPSRDAESETPCDTGETAETPDDTPRDADDAPARLDDTDARLMAERLKREGVSARKAAPLVTRSPATVSRWYRELAPAA